MLFCCTNVMQQPNEARFEPLLAYTNITWTGVDRLDKNELYARLWSRVDWEKIEERLTEAMN